LPGEYTLCAARVDSNLNSGYFPSTASSILGNDKTSIMDMPSFSVQDEDITNLNFYVVPSVWTRFSGLVTRPDGSPAQGARISCNHNWQLIPVDPVTDEEGRFEFSLLGKPYSEKWPWSCTLTATVADFIPPYWPENGPLITNEVHIYAQGSCDVQFYPGDTISDVRIVLKDMSEKKSIVGKIQTEDGKWPVDISELYATQMEYRFPGEMKDDGSYHIDGVFPGQALLVCRVASYYTDTGQFGKQMIQEYCGLYNQVDIPEKETSVTVDIVLKKAGHLAGIVLDSAQNPVAWMVVRTQHPKGFTVDDISGPDGLFWIDGLPMNHEYTLEVARRGDSEPLARFEGLKPTVENIIIGMKDQN
jgi:hypothetical protein